MEWVYLAFLVAIILFVFVVFKRPIYETIMVVFLGLAVVSGSYRQFLTIVVNAAQNTILFTIIAFMGFSQILNKTGVIQDVINIMISLIGRIPGGAGYVSLAASSFMGSLSGSGPGNVATTGIITIPAMKKTGFPAELAAGVEAAASALGPIIPPSGTILVAFGCLNTLYPNRYTISQFWILLWSISLWFILQRFITLFIFCKYYKVKPMAASDIPELRESLRKGWKGLLLIAIVFIPFLLDFLFKDSFFKQRLGTGASNLSACILAFTPCVASVFTLLIARNKNGLSPASLSGVIAESAKSIAPICITVYGGYAIMELFQTLNVGQTIGEYFVSLNMSFWLVAICVPLILTLLSAFLDGLLMISVFGSVIILILVNVRIQPLLAAAMLPAICQAMSEITPPFAIALLPAIGIAESDFRKTCIHAYIWAAGQYIFSVLLLGGCLPLFGKVRWL
jgi:TRAP-type C4-dicarboxylate transport system permease large subunit